MALFKKTNTPDELPDLAIDELKKDFSKDYSQKEETPKPEETPKIVEEKKEETPKPEETQPAEEKEVKEEPAEEIAPPQTQEESEVEEQPADETDKEPDKSEEKVTEEDVNLEKSFFNPLLEELKKENFDPSKINLWYQRKFSEKGAIEEMKEYWEKQKDNFITEAVEKEFKERISSNMKRLQKLEAEWQEIYIKLVKKEEEMKKEEKNIKKIIKDFSQVFGKKRNLKKEHKSR
jgi:hypothetical protein